MTNPRSIGSSLAYSIVCANTSPDFPPGFPNEPARLGGDSVHRPSSHAVPRRMLRCLNFTDRCPLALRRALPNYQRQIIRHFRCNEYAPKWYEVLGVKVKKFVLNGCFNRLYGTKTPANGFLKSL